MSEIPPIDPVPPPVIANPEPPPVVQMQPVAYEPLRAMRFDVAGRIDEDVLCRSCSYNLRGLAMNGECPECHAAVLQSVRGDLLRFCEPLWVARLASSMTWLIAGVTSSIAWVVMMTVISIVLTVGSAAISGGGGGMLGAIDTIAVVQAAGDFVVACVFMVGFWLLTSPDPAEPADTPALTARTLARFMLLVSLLSAPLSTFYTQGITGGMMNPGTGPGGTSSLSTLLNSGFLAIFGAVTGVMGALRVAGCVAAFIVARRLALRVPNPSLAAQTRVVMWGMAVSMSVEVALTALTAIFAQAWIGALAGGGGAGPPPAAFTGIMVLSFGGCIAGVGKLAFGIWLFVLMFIYRAAFKRTAVAATVQWQKPSSPAVIA